MSGHSTVRFRKLDRLGFPGYRVGSDGSVWSQWHRGGSRSVRVRRWRRLTGTVANRHGHRRVHIHMAKGRYVSCRVHRLVLSAFRGPCPKGMAARHFPDRDPANNALSNLRWDTYAENMRDRARHGTQPRGEATSRAKLTEKIVRRIRRLAAAGLGPTAIARKLDLTPPNVSMIVSGKRWAHVK